MNIMTKSTAIPFKVSTDERNPIIYCYVEKGCESVGYEATSKKGWYGSNGIASKEIETFVFNVNGETYVFPSSSRIYVHNSIESLRESELKSERERILSKLTEKERIVLGL